MRRWIEDWNKLNPILADGEVGEVIGTSATKIGDGRSTWKELSYVSTAVDSSFDLATDTDLAAAVSTLQAAATAATDSELSAAILTVNSALTEKQASATAATDAELSAAVALLQSSATAATDSELEAAVATLNSALSAKQDASTAATDAEVAAAISTTQAELNARVEISATALTTADVGNRGKIYVLLGGTGVADSSYICLKDAVDVYAWRPIVVT